MWIRRLIAAHGVERSAPLNRKRPPRRRHPELDDRAWLLRRLAVGNSIHRIAKALGTDRVAVRAALRRHGVTPLAGIAPAEWVEQLDDPADRYIAATAIAEQARALAAQADMMRARAISEMHAAGLSYVAIGEAIGLPTARVRSLATAGRGHG